MNAGVTTRARPIFSVQSRARQRTTIRRRHHAWKEYAFGSALSLAIITAIVLALIDLPALVGMPANVHMEHVTVQAGQTLSSIAVRMDPNADPRVIIDEIQRFNGLGDSVQIYPGEVLRVPVQ